MKESYWKKFDLGLRELYTNYLLIKNKKSKKGLWVHPVLKKDPKDIFVLIEFEGELSELEANGFNTVSKIDSDSAEGMVDLEILTSLASLTQVLNIQFGKEGELELDSSAAEIEARQSGANRHVWSVNQSSGVFNGNTGENVVVGIIDSGIDFRHHNFLKANLSETRILRIWDQGLIVQSGENSPTTSLLSSGSASSYGVEYTDIMINNILNGTSGAQPVRHRDCIGHGTHVAGIAAGNGRQEALNGRSRFEFAGIAPKSKIVVVKLFGLENTPTGVNDTKRFRDAVSYILNVAQAQNNGSGLPVVINCSFGPSTGPHDGLVEQGNQNNGVEGFLEQTFSSSQGKILVGSSGNTAGRRLHASITIPASGSIDVPIELFDSRIFKQNFNKCRYESSTHPIHLDLWYPKITPQTLAVALRVPNVSSFSSNVSLGSDLLNQRFDSNKFFSIMHHAKTATKNGVNFERNNIFIGVTPRNDEFLQGIYTVRLSGDPGLQIHLWCGNGRGFGWKIGNSLPSQVSVTDSHTIVSMKGVPDIITVGAYDDTNDYMACFSSQGPIVSYTSTSSTVTKPDISAPGFKVYSSRSYFERASIRSIPNYLINGILGFHYKKASGTSMASPHITGVVALMLQSNNQLTTQNAISALKNPSSARTAPKLSQNNNCSVALVVNPSDPIAGTNATGGGKVSAKGSVDQLNTP